MTLREWAVAILQGLVLGGIVVLIIETFIKHRFG